MSYRWRLRKKQQHSSVRWFDSEVMPGVRYAIRSVSLGQRIEFLRQARELARKQEFLRAGGEADQFAAAMEELLVRQMYLHWGLVAIEGLRIDRAQATPTLLAESGPEPLANEVIECLRSQLGLTDDERKNS